MEDKLYKSIKRKRDACLDEVRRLGSECGKLDREWEGYQDAIKTMTQHSIINYWKGRAESYIDVLDMEKTERRLSKQGSSNKYINDSLESIQDSIDELADSVRNEIDDLLDEQDNSSDDWDRYSIIEARISALRYLLSCLDCDFYSYRIDCEEL